MNRLGASISDCGLLLKESERETPTPNESGSGDAEQSQKYLKTYSHFMMDIIKPWSGKLGSQKR
jgi:hypothetical protein